MISNIAVLGAGTMGLGIALLFATRGYTVTLFEPNHDARASAELKLRSARDMKECDDVGVCLLNDLEKAVACADLIIEAVPEQLDIKLDVYKRLAAMIKEDAIVASNTSTFALETLASDQPFADRMVITHFFNPAQLIPLVEIVGLPSTPPEVVEEIVQLLRKCNKVPVVLRKDIPGFIANRLQAAMMREACYLLDNGIADVEQIDVVVKEGLGLRYAFKGPFEIADLGGLDIWTKVTGHLFPELDTSEQPPESLQTKVKNGELGVKSGKGYYEYVNPTGTAADMRSDIEDLVSLKIKKHMKRGCEDDG